MSLGPRARTLVRSVLAAGVVFVALELAARLLAPEPAPGILVRRPLLALYAGLERPEEVFSSLDHDSLEWSPYLHWVTKPNRQARFFRTNALGFRGPEIAQPKPERRVRVVVLGGSVAWGLGATADDRTVAGRLEAHLRQRRPGLDLEVVNAGQVGFVSGQELILYHRVVAALRPDLVLLFDGYNDVEADFSNPVSDWPQNATQLKTRYEDFLRSGRLGADLARALRHSRLLDLGARWIAARREAPAGPWTPAVEPEATARSYVRNVVALSRVAAPVPVWIALQPVLATIRKPLAPDEQRMLAEKEQLVRGYTRRVRAAYQAIQEGATASGLSVIPLDDALGASPVLMFADECHFGDEAADRAAQAIAESFVERGALPAANP
jgi:lysophospholipase L1-like esterase